MNFAVRFDRLAVLAVSLALGFAVGCSSDPSPTSDLIDAGAPDAPDGGEPDAPPRSI